MHKTQTASQMEFDVNMKSTSCEDAIRNALKSIEGIESLSIDVLSQRVLITTTQPSAIIQSSIEKTGLLAVLKGHGSDENHLGAAVSILKRNRITYGLVRFLQVNKDNCIIDASFNGLPPGKYGLHIHELGDLSEGCESTGDDFNPNNGIHGDKDDENRHAGDMGNVEIGSNGSSILRYEDDLIKVWDIIGRAVVLHEREDDFSPYHNHGNAGKGTCTFEKKELVPVSRKKIPRKRFRNAILVAEILAITLHFLTTGNSRQSLSISFRVGKSTISKIVVETCDELVIYEPYSPAPQT